MPLLDIKQTRKVTAICSLEESTAIQVDQYAAFVKCLPDEVVNKALEYTFGKDSDFQKFRSSDPKVPAQLRIKKAGLSAYRRSTRTEARKPCSGALSQLSCEGSCPHMKVTPCVTQTPVPSKTANNRASTTEMCFAHGNDDTPTPSRVS